MKHDRPSFALRQTTPPAVEPIGLQEAKDHLRQDGDFDDAYIDALIATVRDRTERHLNRSLITQGWDLAIDWFPAEIRPPRCRLQAVSQITYVDTEGALQVLDPGDYDVDLLTEPGRIQPAFEKTWPGTRKVMNAIWGSGQMMFTNAAAVAL